MTHYDSPISQMHQGVDYKMMLVEEKYRMDCLTSNNLKSDIMSLENKSKVMAESHYYQEPSEELENLRAELSECQAALERRDREVAWLIEDNERLMTKHCYVQPRAIGTNPYACNDDDEKAKREREIQVLEFRIEQITTEKDIVELKLDEMRQENETLRKTLASTNNNRRDDPDLDKDSLLSDNSSDPSGDYACASNLYEMTQNETARPGFTKLMIKAFLSKIKTQQRRNKQLAKALEMEREKNQRGSEIIKVKSSSRDSYNEAELNSLLMDRTRLSMALTAEELNNSSLQQAIKDAQHKLQRAQNLETELTEQRRHNWDLECERMDVEFEHHRLLRDTVYSIKLMTEAVEAAQGILRAWNTTGQSISPLLGPAFYHSFDKIGFFLKNVKNYEEKAAKVENKASRRKEATATKAEAGGSPTHDTENSMVSLPNQRYRKAYRNLRREYDDLRDKHDVLIDRYQGIKAGLTTAMYQSAVQAANVAFHQQQKKTAAQKRKKCKSQKHGPKKVVRVMLSCDEESS